MDVVIVGAGGHGKVVLDILREQGIHKPIGFVDADISLAGTTIHGLPVIGPANTLPKLRQNKVRCAIIGIGDNRARLQYAQILHEGGFELINAVHPSAIVSKTAKLGQNIVIAALVAVCTDAQIGDSVILNTGAIVDHECMVGTGAHICPGVRLAGRVRVGACAFVGLGSNVIQCLSIGDHAIIGAGATVLTDVPEFATAVGIPARVVKMAEPVLAGG